MERNRITHVIPNIQNPMGSILKLQCRLITNNLIYHYLHLIKDFWIIQPLHTLSTLAVPDTCYNRNTSCTLIKISMFLFMTRIQRNYWELCLHKDIVLDFNIEFENLNIFSHKPSGKRSFVACLIYHIHFAVLSWQWLRTTIIIEWNWWQ